MIKTNYLAQITPQFRVLSNDQIREIHFSTLELLEIVGVKVDNKEALELLYSYGSYIGKDNIVKIPSHLVEDAIRVTPSRVGIYNRDGKRYMSLEGRKSYFGGTSSSLFVVDPYNFQTRKCLLQDVINLAKINDYLENMFFILPEGHAYDLDSNEMHRIEVMEVLKNSKTPIVLQTVLEYMDNMVEMAAIVSGGYDNLKKYPNIICYAEPLSPLYHSEEIAVALKAVDYGLPVVYTSMPIGGATSPVTLAGSIIQCNAECLSGLVVLQLKKKGHPCIYGGIPSPLDMGTTIFPYGAPELSLMSAALTEIGHYYDVPVFGTAGITDSKTIDAQAGVELTWSGLFSVLSGANLIHDVGFLSSNKTVSMELHVLMDEIISAIKYLCGGIKLNDEEIAMDIINKVGPMGTFLYEEHTFNNFKRVWRPCYFDRTGYREDMEHPNLFNKLNRKVKDIIDNHQTEALSEDIIKELENCRKGWK